MARVQGMTPEGIRKAIAEAISFIKDLNVEDLNKLLAAFEDANGIFDVRLVEAQEEVKKAGEKALEAEAQAKLIIDELARYQELQDVETDRILAEVATAIEAANLASDQLPALFERLTTAEAGLDFANTEFDTLIVKQDEFRDAVAEQTAEVARINTEFVAVNQAAADAVEKVDQSTIKVNQIGGDLELARATLDAKIKKNQEDITDAQKVADEHQNAIETLTGNLDGLTTDYSTLSSNFSTEVENLEAADASLLSSMNTKVGDLRATTDAQATAISAVRAQADKGVSDAAAAKSAADQAALDATNKSNAAREAAEDYAKEQAEAAQARAEETAAAEALRVARLEAAAAKVAAATDAQTKADEAERLAKLYAEAQAKTAKEQAEATAAQDAATKAENARIAAEANAKVLSDKAQQAAVAAQSSIDNLEIGGRNLLLNSANWRYTSSDYGTSIDRATPGKLTVLQEGSWNAYEWTTSSWINAETFFDGKSTYTFSVELRVTSPGGGTARISFDVREGGSVRQISYGEDVGDTEGDWIKSTVMLTLPNKGENRSLLLIRGTGTAPGDVIEYRNAKLERGNKATDWTPAPEDADAAIQAAQTAADEAKADAVNKAAAAQTAAEKYAKEKSEADKAAAETAAAAEALRVAKAEAAAAKKAAATDAQTKATAAETAAKTYAVAQAKAAKEAAEATAAADAKAKADAATFAAEGTAKQLADAAQAAAESKSKADLDSLEIGGRNLAEKSVSVVDRLGSPSGSRREYSNFDMGTPYNSVPEGVDITISFDLEMVFNHATTRTLQVYCSNRRGPKGFLARTLKFDDIPQGETFKGRVYVNTKSTIPNSQTNDTCFVEFYSIYDTDNWYKVTNLKVERGTKATDWTPAPEDVDAGIATAQSTADTARTEAETKANQALQDATTALTNYQKVNDPKVSNAQSDASAAKSAADNARAQADKANDLLTVQDTRATNELPHYYWTNYNKTTAIEFKSAESLGLTGGYGTLTTMVPWHDSSGGSIQQTFVVNNGGATYKRRSRGSRTDATWGEWVNELAELNSQISTLATKADTLTTGLSNAATQEQYNQLNTELWGDQGSINKLQGEINDNNQEFQDWQREVNARRDIWEKASTDATAALGRFAITQSQWNTLSATATNANTKALASHAALFEGQNKWNAVATAAIESQATLLAKQDRWSDGVNKALAWQDQLNNSQSDINKTTKSVLANQAKWNSAQAIVNDSQSDINKATQSVLLNQGKWNTAQEKVNNDQSELNKAVKLVQDKQIAWNDGVTKALASHDELFKTTSITFKAVKEVNTNQGKWNKVVSDLITTNSNVSAANKTAIEGLNRVLGLRTSSSNVVPMVPGGVRTGGTDIAPIFTPTPAWMTKGSRVTVTDIPGITSIDAIQQTGQATHQFEPYYSEIDPTIEYKYSYWAKANVTDTRIYIELRSGESAAFPIESNTQDNHSSSGQYLAGNVLLAAGWKQYTGTIRFKPDVRTIYFKAIYYNHSNGATGTQTLADIQIYPNIPSQADVNKALTDSDAAQNTLLAKQESWNDAASRSISTVENLWGKTDAEVGELNTLAEELSKRITDQGNDFAKSVSEMMANFPRVAYAVDGQDAQPTDTDGFIEIVRTKSGDRTTRVLVVARGSWIGSMLVEADHGRSDGTNRTFFNLTPIRQKIDVLTGSRIFTLNRNTDVDHIGAVKITYFVKPGRVVPNPGNGTNVYPDPDKWKILQSYRAPETEGYTMSLNVTWGNTTYHDYYGVRIRVGSTVVTEIKKDRVGPLLPGQGGVRSMPIGIGPVRVPAGTTIYLEALSSAKDRIPRRISSWSGDISYITSGRG